MTNLLNSKRFLPLFITQFFGAFNDNAFKNALLIWLTYDVAVRNGQNPQIIVSIAAGLFILPFFLFSAIAGNLADYYEKSRLIQKIKQIEIILMLLCFLGFYLENIYILLVILFAMGAQSSFFGPLKYSLLPIHLKKNELILGNGIIEAGTFISILLGTIFGGIIIRTDNGTGIICIMLVFFAIIGYLSSCFIPITQPKRQNNNKIKLNIITQTIKIINHAKADKKVFSAIISISWFWMIGMVFLTQFPIYTKDIINGDEKIVTLFLSIFSIGIAIGSILCNKVLKGKITEKLIPYGLYGISLSIIVLFLLGLKLQEINNIDQLININQFLFQNNNYGIYISFSLLSLAVFAGIYIVPLYAIIQHYAKEEFLSRIIAANNIINALFMVLATILVITLFQLNLNINEIFLFIAILNILKIFLRN